MPFAPRSFQILLIGLLLTLTGCLYYGRYGIQTPTVPNAIDPDYFRSDLSETEPGVISTRDRSGYSIRKLQFGTHLAHLYIPDGIRNAPAVLILPITQGDYYTKQIAQVLVQKGFVGLRFQSRGQLLSARLSRDAFQGFEAAIRSDVIAVLGAVNWLSRQSYVDADRIGIVGISMGAIVGSIAAGVDPRIRSGVFMLGGGDLAGILFSSKEPGLVSLRKRIENEEDLSPEELVAEAGRRLRNVDPLTYAGRLDPSRILMINAFFDDVIKRRYGKAFWRAAGEPPMIMLPTGHYSAGLFFPYATRRMLKHLEREFGGE